MVSRPCLLHKARAGAPPQARQQVPAALRCSDMPEDKRRRHGALRRACGGTPAAFFFYLSYCFRDPAAMPSVRRFRILPGSLFPLSLYFVCQPRKSCGTVVCAVCDQRALCAGISCAYRGAWRDGRVEAGLYLSQAVCVARSSDSFSPIFLPSPACLHSLYSIYAAP